MHATNQKYQEAGHEFVTGTGGQLDYLLIARDKETGATLSVKPMLASSYHVTHCILRVRLAPGDNSYTNPDGWVNSFSKFAWEKTWGAPRKSLMTRVILGRSHADMWQVPYDLEKINFYGQVAAFFKTNVPRSDWVIDSSVLEKFLHSAFEEAVQSYPAPPSKESLQKQIDAAKAVIVDLETQLEKTSGSVEAFLTPTKHRQETLSASGHASKANFADGSAGFVDSDGEEDEDGDED